jgi:hypothetical protein
LVILMAGMIVIFACIHLSTQWWLSYDQFVFGPRFFFVWLSGE